MSVCAIDVVVMISFSTDGSTVCVLEIKVCSGFSKNSSLRSLF